MEKLHNLSLVLSPTSRQPIEEVDVNITARELIGTLMTKMALPAGTTGELVRKSTGEIIPADRTLKEVGVTDNEDLLVEFERTAGGTTVTGNAHNIVIHTPDNHYDTLNVRLSLPSLLTLDEFFDQVVDTTKAVGFIYSIFALIHSGDIETMQNLAKFIKENGKTTDISNSLLHRYLVAAGVEPLRVGSIHYGSPASFDLLGIGKVLEVVRDILKDLAWHGRHEEQMAELERRSKQIEINKARLEVENAAVEITTRKLEIEKINLEIATQKVDLLEKAIGLQIPDNDKRILFSALVPRLSTIARNPVSPMLRVR